LFEAFIIMRTIKIMAISILATFAMATVSFAATDDTAKTTAANVITALTSQNGVNAGSALLGLYTQYKTDGKLDLKNINNVNNIIKLVSNVKNLASQKTNTSFISGLISGSKDLVTDSNSSSVVNTLASLSDLDLSKLEKASISAASKASQNSNTGLLSRLLGKASQSIAETPKSNEDANTAVSVLSNLFSTLGK